jgi:hypothetical protein
MSFLASLVGCEGDVCQKYSANITMPAVIYKIPSSGFPIQKSLAIAQDL